MFAVPRKVGFEATVGLRRVQLLVCLSSKEIVSRCYDQQDFRSLSKET